LGLRPAVGLRRPGTSAQADSAVTGSHPPWACGLWLAFAGRWRRRRPIPAVTESHPSWASGLRAAFADRKASAQADAWRKSAQQGRF